MLVTGADNTKEIVDIFKSNEPIKCAVAFWGSDSISLLNNSTKPVQIICNLESGATNPFALETIKKYNKNVVVKSHPRLHAKVYWSAQKCIVGSANCSANGLSYEDAETSAWLEASIVTEDKDIINATEKWFDSLWKDLKEVSYSDIKGAMEIYNKRRKIRQIQNKTDSLLEAFNNSPESFKDKRIFFVMWADEASDGDEEAFKKAVAEGIPEITSKKLDFFVDWPQIPVSACLISFKYHPNRNPSPTNFLISSTLDKHVKRKGFRESSLIICPIQESIEGLKLPRNKSIFKTIASKLWEKGRGDDCGKILDIYDAKDILLSVLR